jgi:hypothetical protein
MGKGDTEPVRNTFRVDLSKAYVENNKENSCELYLRSIVTAFQPQFMTWDPMMDQM